jgi:hypothetical protein
MKKPLKSSTISCRKDINDFMLLKLEILDPFEGRGSSRSWLATAMAITLWVHRWMAMMEDKTTQSHCSILGEDFEVVPLKGYTLGIGIYLADAFHYLSESNWYFNLRDEIQHGPFTIDSSKVRLLLG